MQPEFVICPICDEKFSNDQSKEHPTLNCGTEIAVHYYIEHTPTNTIWDDFISYGGWLEYHYAYMLGVEP